MPLDELRKEIDRLDEEIVRLIGERAEIARRIGEIKRVEGVGAYSPERERAVYEKVASYNVGPVSGPCIRAVYREIMAGAIALQKPTAVAYLGPAGSLGHLAAREKFGAAIEYRECAGIERVLQVVSRGEADYGVVPIENRAEAGASVTMDLLAGNSLVSVISETLEGVARFFVIGRQPTRPTGRDKTSLVIHARDGAGALHGALKAFVDGGINLTRIESRASRGRARDCGFFVELEGHVEDERVRRAIAELGRLAEVAVLGSYPAAGS